MEAVVLESRNAGEDSLHTTGVCSTATCEGENCATSGCHTPDTNNILFSITGTVFQYQDLNLAYIDSYASIEFYSSPAGSGELVKSLEVDAFGNFYSTEPITTLVYPALRYEDNSGNIKHLYMPRPLVPRRPAHCNQCHLFALPPTEMPTFNFPGYLRISNGVISSAGADTNYHLDGDKGPNCMNCHGIGSGNTVFTLAGSVYLPMVNSEYPPYTLADAAIGLFTEECDDLRYGCQPSVAPEDVVIREKVPKLFIEINSRGHFYTTQPIDWTTLPTYPTLANYDANTLCRNIKHMISDIQGNAGNCYFCHDGITQAPITISGEFNIDEKCDPDPLTP